MAAKKPYTVPEKVKCSNCKLCKKDTDQMSVCSRNNMPMYSGRETRCVSYEGVPQSEETKAAGQVPQTQTNPSRNSLF